FLSAWTKQMTTELNITLGPVALGLSWPGGDRQDYPYIWLRDNDPAGFHPVTEERTADLLEIPATPQAETAAFAGDAIEVHWRDGATSRFGLDWLNTHRPGKPSLDPARRAPVVWRSGFEVARFAADAILGSDGELRDWLDATATKGITIIEGVGREPGAGLAMAQRVGFLRETNFGVSFEVKSKPNPINLAYTALALPLHTDLPNQELPPGFQFLHCIANEASGGGSVFADGYALAEALRDADPAAFDLLARIPIPFRFHDRSTDIRVHHPVIGLAPGSDTVQEVCWSTHMADTFDMAADVMPAYYDAYRAFMTLTRDPAFQVRLKLKAGEIVVFDNRRILHGRDAFNPNEGYRHLQGCYVDRGEFLARLRVLSRV
ncbi:MAG: TauD/TfdA family dioxygenase, partial [Pseudomonadota bacterium]